MTASATQTQTGAQTMAAAGISLLREAARHRETGLDRFLLDRDELTVVARLVRRGLMSRGTADSRQRQRTYHITVLGDELLDGALSR